MTPVLNNNKKLLGWSLVFEFLPGAREAEIFPAPHPPTGPNQAAAQSEITLHEANDLPLTESTKSDPGKANQPTPHIT